ncbi:MAG TPA: LTA synthase family protein [Bacteroidia bacterium]
MKRLLQLLQLMLCYLAVFELSRLYFLVYGYSMTNENLITVFAITAYKGFLLDLSSVAYCITPFVFFFITEGLIKYKIPVKVYKVIAVIELFLIAAITIADPELYKQWGSKFNNQVLVYVSHPLEMAASTGAVNWLKTGLMSVVFIPLVFFIGIKIFKILEKDIAISIQHTIVNVLNAAFLFVLLRGGLGVATISQSSAIFSENRFYNSASINSFWNALYYIFNDTGNLYDQSYLPYDEPVAKQSFQKQVSEPFNLPDLTILERPNVMIIMLESFTASGSQFFSGYNNCMPYLDKIAKENLCFTSCYSSGDRTEKGLVAVYSGYPAQPASSIIVFPDKMAKLPSLGKSLGSIGYKSLFMYGGDADFASMKAYMVVHGVDEIIDKKSFGKSELNSKWGAHDGNLFNKVLEKHQNIQQPFLSTIMTLSSHEPFEVPFESTDLPKDEWYAYKNSIRYADKCLYDFLEKCKQTSWYKNTLIVLVADHGHDIGLENKHFFGKEKFHIPLIITGGALDDKLRGVNFNGVVSQTIIPSLLLSGIGLDIKSFNWQTNSVDSGFAQYHYNSGFGRVKAGSESVYDNLQKTFYFKGNSVDSLNLLRTGREFQQVLVADFLQK